MVIYFNATIFCINNSKCFFYFSERANVDEFFYLICLMEENSKRRVGKSKFVPKYLQTQSIKMFDQKYSKLNNLEF